MINQDNSVNLFLSTTINQFVHCLEVIWSIRLNTDREINAWVLVDQLPSFNVDYKKYKINMNIVDAKNLKLDATHEKIVNDSYSTLGYGRLFITRIVPAEVKKLRYLDTDIYAYNNINELYDTNIDGKYAAVVLDVSVQCFAKNELKLTKVSKYFNAGMMLLNLDKIREDKVDDACIEFYFNPPDWYIQNDLCIKDQTILNYCFKENVLFVNPKYSIQTLTFGYGQYNEYIKQFGYADLQQLISSGVLVHMQGKAKPWDFEQFLHWQSYQLMSRIWVFDIWNSIKKSLLLNMPQVKELYNI